MFCFALFFFNIFVSDIITRLLVERVRIWERNNLGSIGRRLCHCKLNAPRAQSVLTFIVTPATQNVTAVVTGKLRHSLVRVTVQKKKIELSLESVPNRRRHRVRRGNKYNPVKTSCQQKRHTWYETRSIFVERSKNTKSKLKKAKLSNHFRLHFDFKNDWNDGHFMRGRGNGMIFEVGHAQTQFLH